MKCKTENPGKGEFECLKEGRKVTRCARSVYVPHAFVIYQLTAQPRLHLGNIHLWSRGEEVKPGRSEETGPRVYIWQTTETKGLLSFY